MTRYPADGNLVFFDNLEILRVKFLLNASFNEMFVGNVQYKRFSCLTLNYYSLFSPDRLE